MTLKIADMDGIEQCRVWNRDDPRAIEFGSQIENTEDQHGTNVLGKKHKRKFVVHSILMPEDEREEEVDTNEEASDGIRKNKSCAASMLHNKTGYIEK